jgi:protein tyrosine phosphatase
MREDDRGGTGFHEDYNDLSMEDSHRFSADKCTAAVNNPTLNRYRDILPYDVARVMLNADVPDNDTYINASSIVDLLPGSPQYFTAQGPKPETVGHFWKMVAQYRSGVIVMVTRCNESGRVKCEQYWPTEEEGSRHFAEDESGPAVSVVATGEIAHETWTERRFTILQKSGSFDVVQLHFEDWPDHGTPPDSTSRAHTLD